MRGVYFKFRCIQYARISYNMFRSVLGTRQMCIRLYKLGLKYIMSGVNVQWNNGTIEGIDWINFNIEKFQDTVII